jgi:hypothetical protein
MKKLAVLIALILALSSTASALTLTTDDIRDPYFQWGRYWLTLSLYTDDPAEIDYEPIPAQGALAMVRLTSSGGQIALQDIESGAKQFLLKDAPLNAERVDMDGAKRRRRNERDAGRV